MAHESIHQLIERRWAEMVSRNPSLREVMAEDPSVAGWARTCFCLGFVQGHGAGYEFAEQVDKRLATKGVTL